MRGAKVIIIVTLRKQEKESWSLVTQSHQSPPAMTNVQMTLLLLRCNNRPARAARARGNGHWRRTSKRAHAELRLADAVEARCRACDLSGRALADGAAG